MNQSWNVFLQQHRARFADDTVADFGSPEDELAAAAEESVVVPLTGFGLIRASGEDAATFLHSLMTNDVSKLTSSAAQFNSFCSAKGRMLANFVIWREDGDYLLQLSRDLQPAMQKKLSMYVLRSKVKLSDAGQDRVLLGLSGPAADIAMAELADVLPEASLGLVRFPGGCAVRIGAGRYQLALEPARAEALWPRLAQLAKPAGFPAWQWLNVRDGIPWITSATQEQFVPQMVNFELIGGVDFRKGCYPGQEIVARTQYLGKLKRRMYRGHVDAEAVRAGAELFSPDLPEQSCGLVVTAAPAPEGGYELLAVMQMSSFEAGDVHLAAPAGPRLALRPLPYAVP